MADYTGTIIVVVLLGFSVYALVYIGYSIFDRQDQTYINYTIDTDQAKQTYLYYNIDNDSEIYYRDTPADNFTRVNTSLNYKSNVLGIR